MYYIDTPQYNNPFPGDHENYNSSIPFLSHHYSILISLCIRSPGVEKTMFKKFINFKLFTSKLPPRMVGVMKFTNSCLFTL